MSVGGAFAILDPDEGQTLTGFDDLEVGVKYVFFKNAEHETLLSVGLEADVGGTGSAAVETEPVSTLVPPVFFGKGFGDLPDPVELLRPLAITGVLGVGFPIQGHTEILAEDGGIEREFNFQSRRRVTEAVQPDDSARRVRHGDARQWSRHRPDDGHHQSRIIWFGRYVQVGVQAVIPVNSRSGTNVGVLGQVHFFLDDIAPQIFTWTPFDGTLGSSVPR